MSCQQKALARRCGLQALSIYPKEEMSDWSSARNHLEQVLGRQAYNTGHAEQALQHFINLLSVRGNVQEGGDTETCQGILDDFKLAWDVSPPRFSLTPARRVFFRSVLTSPERLI